MDYRIVKYKKGFVVEVQKKTWFGITYWTHLISVAGIKSEPWFHSSYEHAESNLLDEIKNNTLKNSLEQAMLLKTIQKDQTKQ